MLISGRQTVGSRELKTRLGTYLRLVQEGLSLVVTDRGRPVAELRPLSAESESLEGRFSRLAALGVVSGEVAERRPLAAFEPIVASGPSASDAVSEDREDRF